MKRIVLFSMLLWGCASPSQTKVKVDQKVGYKDLPLDKPLSYFKGKVALVLYEEDTCTASKEFSVSSSQYLTIGKEPLKEVTLEFIRDSLYRTRLEKENSGLEGDNLIAVYTTEFGEPAEDKIEESGISYKQYKWDGKKHYIKIIDRVGNMTIEYGSNAGLGRWYREWDACEERKKKSLQGNL